MVEGQPLAQMLHGFVRRVAVKRHHCSGTAGRTRNLRAEPVAADRRHFDAVLTAIDLFVEALDGHGKAAFCAPRCRRASERRREGASTCSKAHEFRRQREKIIPSCQNVHKLSTVHPHVFHRAVSPSRLHIPAERVRGLARTRTRTPCVPRSTRRRVVPTISRS